MYDLLVIEPEVERVRGGQTKKTQRTIDALMQAFHQGAPIRVACGYAGIGVDTYMRWCRNDPEFGLQMAQARDRTAIKNLAIAQQATLGVLRCNACGTPNDFPIDPKLAIDILRVTHPEDFSKKNEITVDVHNYALDVHKVAEVLMEALQPYPEARIAAAGALASLEEAE